MGLKPSLRSRLRKAEEMVRGVNRAGGELTADLQTQVDTIGKRLGEIERRVSRVQDMVYRPVRSKMFDWFCGLMRRVQGIV